MKILGQARLFAIHYQFLVFDSARLVDVEKLAQWTVNIEPGDYGIYCLAYNLGSVRALTSISNKTP